MVECVQAATRPILVVTSEVSEAALARSAVEELGLIPVLVQEAGGAMRLLGGSPKRFAAVVAGERVGRASGFTFCGVARDAGCRLPMLLLTGDDCRWTAVRAARLQISVLWQPVPVWRIAQTLLAMLPRRPCAVAGTIKLPAWPRGAPEAAPLAAAAGTAPARSGETHGWRRSKNVW
jgi:DNA-binding NtrC family response regulator